MRILAAKKLLRHKRREGWGGENISCTMKAINIQLETDEVMLLKSLSLEGEG